MRPPAPPTRACAPPAGARYFPRATLPLRDGARGSETHPGREPDGFSALFLYRATEPALNPIRRVMPNLGGIDVSPLVLIIGLIFVRSLMFEYLA